MAPQTKNGILSRLSRWLRTVGKGLRQSAKSFGEDMMTPARMALLAALFLAGGVAGWQTHSKWTDRAAPQLPGERMPVPQELIPQAEFPETLERPTLPESLEESGRSDGAEEAARGAEPALPVLNPEQLAWPVSGTVLQDFGWHRHPEFGDWRFSNGVLLGAYASNAPVAATFEGRVEEVSSHADGWRVVMRHGGDWLSEYRGLGRVDVNEGDIVGAGQTLGLAASSPDRPGVVFGLRQGDEPIDPMTLGVPVQTAGAPIGSAGEK